MLYHTITYWRIIVEAMVTLLILSFGIKLRSTNSCLQTDRRDEMIWREDVERRDNESSLLNSWLQLMAWYASDQPDINNYENYDYVIIIIIILFSVASWSLEY